MASYLRPRRGKRATAIAQNIVLKRGEVFFECPDSGVGTGIGRIKVGDGITAYKDLPYFMSIDAVEIDVDDSKVIFTEATSTDNSVLLNAISSGSSIKVIVSNVKKLLRNLVDGVTKLNNDLENKAGSNHTHTWESIANRPSTFTPESHNHNDLYYTESEITNLLAQYSKTSHNHDSVYSKNNHIHSYTSLTNIPSTFTPSSHSHAWGEITGKPSTFAPSSHNHNDLYYTKTEITNLFSPVAVFTSEDIGEGVSVTYPDNTLICVYEEV